MKVAMTGYMRIKRDDEAKVSLIIVIADEHQQPYP
jgi:hypothetical protein